MASEWQTGGNWQGTSRDRIQMLSCRIPEETEGYHENPQFYRCAIRNSKEDLPNASQKHFFLSKIAWYNNNNNKNNINNNNDDYYY